MNTFKDVQDDKSLFTLVKKLNNFGENTQSLIKTASVDYDELSQLPDSAFAWPEMRKLAFHSKEHTALSLVYADGENIPSHARNTLEKAAAIYGITLDRKPVVKTASQTSHVVNKDDYLLPEKRMCKVASAQDVISGIHFLSINKKELTPADVTHASEVLVKKAEDHSVQLPISFLQEAGRVYASLEKTAEWLEARVYATEDEKSKEAYTKLAAAVKENVTAKLTKEELIKLASSILTLDTVAGITNMYDKSIPSARRTVFNTTKVAERTMVIAGKSYPLAAVSDVGLDTLKQVLGDDIAPEITDDDGNVSMDQLEDVLSALPADIQLNLSQVLTSLGL